MNSASAKKTNRLFRNMVIISVGVHLVIFMHISGLYNSEAISYLEMTVREFSKPVARNIPKPRLRTKTPVLPKEIKKLVVQKQIIPPIKMNKMDPLEKNLPDSIVENISMPELPDIPGLKVAQWQPIGKIGADDYMMAKEYYEMVRLRIESNKKYPRIAKDRGIQGRIVVRFMLFPDGRAKEIRIVKSSRNKALDKAALNAVSNSSPFLRPPWSLFKEPVNLEISIVFELG